MNIKCSVCGSDDDLRVTPSTLFPASRFVSCAECRVEGREPRPLVALALSHGDEDKAKMMIRERRYLGDKISAEEMLELMEVRAKHEAEIKAADRLAKLALTNTM